MESDDLVEVDLERSGVVRMPVAYAGWLDQAGLFEAFDAWWVERRDAGVHGDAFTPFAERHLAPLSVQQCLPRLA
jgi:hypothetical protein